MSDEETKKSEQLLKRAFRFPQSSIAERIVCQHLYLGTATNPTKTIDHSCAASMLVDSLHQNVENLDIKLLKRIHLLNQAFQNPVKERINNYQWAFSVEYPFDYTKENYDLYIKPWQVNFAIFRDPQLLHHFGVRLSKEPPVWEEFFEYSRVMTEHGFKRLRSAFFGYAIPLCQKAIVTMSTLVSPKTFDEVSKLMAGAYARQFKSEARKE